MKKLYVKYRDFKKHTNKSLAIFENRVYHTDNIS